MSDDSSAPLISERPLVDLVHSFKPNNRRNSSINYSPKMLLIVISIFVAIATYIYWTLNKRNKYWEIRGVPYKTPLLFYGNIKERLTMQTSFHLFYRKLYFEFENHKYYGIYEGRIPSLMIRDPELIRNILSKDFDHFVDRTPSRFKSPQYTKYMLLSITGNQWKQVRASVTPTFTSGRIKAMCGTVEECAITMVQHLMNKLNKSEHRVLEGVDVKDLYGKTALDVIASTAFGVQCNSFDTDGSTEFAQKITKFNQISVPTRYFLLSLLLLDLPTWLTKHITLSFFNKDTVDFLAKVYMDTVKYRTTNNVRRNDFLQLLMDAQRGVLEKDDSSDANAKENMVTEDVAIAQSVLFFIAGYETSSSLLTMASYVLAQEQTVQDKLREEINSAFEENEHLTYEKINDLHYLDMVLSETLRMYPPVARLDRLCTKAYKIDNLDIPPGGRVFIPCVGIHMDPKYYPEPEKFIPERFSSDEKAKRHPYVYMPFGIGPRNCIGLRFALMSTKIIMAHMLRNFIIDVDKETPIPFNYDERSLLLKPKGGQMKLKLRAVTY